MRKFLFIDDVIIITTVKKSSMKVLKQKNIVIYQHFVFQHLIDC